MQGMATRVSPSPSLSPDCYASATAFHTRLQALARRSVTHVVHLLIGTEAGGPFRLMTVPELSSPPSSNRRDRLPRWLCEELLAAVPPSILQLISDAAALRAADPSLTPSPPQIL